MLGHDLEVPSLVLTEVVGGLPLGLIDGIGLHFSQQSLRLYRSLGKTGLAIRFNLNHVDLRSRLGLNLQHDIGKVAVDLVIHGRPIGHGQFL